MSEEATAPAQGAVRAEWLDFEFFASDEYVLPFAAAIAGPPGIGKTTLALSLSNHMPVYFLETEHRFAYIAKKMQKEIKHPERIKCITVNNWNHLIAALGVLRELVANSDPRNKGVVVIDSGTDFKNFADEQWRKDSPSYPPVNWSSLYKMMNKVVHGIRGMGLSVVFTNRVKDEYDGDSKTGRKRPDAYKNQEDLTEVFLMLNEDGTFEVIKNSWHDRLLWDNDAQRITREMDLFTIIQTLQENTDEQLQPRAIAG